MMMMSWGPVRKKNFHTCLQGRRFFLHMFSLFKTVNFYFSNLLIIFCLSCWLIKLITIFFFFFLNDKIWFCHHHYYYCKEKKNKYLQIIIGVCLLLNFHFKKKNESLKSGLINFLQFLSNKNGHQYYLMNPWMSNVINFMWWYIDSNLFKCNENVCMTWHSNTFIYAFLIIHLCWMDIVIVWK